MEIQEIQTNKIEVLENIRQKPLKEDLDELMNSIKQQGLMQPIGVKQYKDGYVLVWGFRRLTAFKKLGYTHIPARILEETEELTEEDLLVLNAIENIQRKTVNMIELGRICFILRKKMSIGEVASRLSIPQSRVKNAIDEFMKVPEKHRNQIVLFDARMNVRNKKGYLSTSVTGNLLKLKNVTKEQREELFEWARKEEKNATDIQVLGVLLKSEMSLKQAMTQLDKYRAVTIKLAVNKKKFDEVTKNKAVTITKFIRTALNKEVKGLVF